MVTHAHALVRHYNKRIVILQDGEVVADGGLKTTAARQPGVVVRPAIQSNCANWQPPRYANSTM
jgi:ABC-type methionine transport system ATPase subunit